LFVFLSEGSCDRSNYAENSALIYHITFKNIFKYKIVIVRLHSNTFKKSYWLQTFE